MCQPAEKPELGVSEMLLEKLQFAAVQHFGPTLAEGLRLRQIDVIEACADEMWCSVRGFILNSTVAEDSREITYPRDWWQAFRARWLPEWWLSRRPVVNTSVTVTFEQKAIFPFANLTLPDSLGAPVMHCMTRVHYAD